MNYEERKQQICRECRENYVECPYVSRKLEYKCQNLTETMYGQELGYKDAIDNVFDLLIDRYENQGVILLEDINEFKQVLEEQQ